MGKLGFTGTADRDLSGKKYSGCPFSFDSVHIPQKQSTRSA